MLATCLLLAAQTQTPVFEFDVASQSGLTIKVGDLPIVRGSWFQYYEPDWSKGYYSSTYNRQTVTRIDSNTVKVTFAGSNGQVEGSQTFTRTGNTLKVVHEYRWNGDRPVKIETTAGMPWAPVFRPGTATLDGARGKDLERSGLKDMDSRRFGPDARTLVFDAPAMRLTLAASVPLTSFDARNYAQDFANSKELFWVGALGLDVAKGKPAIMEVTWTVEPKVLVKATDPVSKVTSMPLKVASAPSDRKQPLIPKPKSDHLNWTKPIELTGAYRWPIGRFRFSDEFFAALGRRFVLPVADPKAKALSFDGGEARLGMKPGGYRIIVDQKNGGEISVIGQDQFGLRFGLRRLASLVYAKDGKLWLPTGYLLDEPVNQWRGVHLFVGPEALGFQKKLWNRALLNLGFNKVVLQCERTDWKTTPGIKTSITMPREDLAKLFDSYRSYGVEPIPLVQSFGHMEWLFAGGQNKDLAFNPDALYSIDPRVPRSTQVLKDLWAEVIAITKAETIHFGLDEVDMIGWPDDPELVTTLWEKQLPILAEIAKSHEKRMMLWGDMALAPNEAPDAANGVNATHAHRRKAVIPKNAWIADWHYKPDENPDTFMKPIQTWKTSGQTSIASTWYRPENIRGFTLAANQTGIGALQTTWAGYESNETNMIREFQQFSAMVLAADYAWSGRPESVQALGYDPGEVFRELYFGTPSPIKPAPGTSWVRADSEVADLAIGSNRFVRFAAIGVGSLVNGSAPRAIELAQTPRAGRSVAIALDCEVRVDDGVKVADLTVQYDKGPATKVALLYGGHVRAGSDPGVCAASAREIGISCVNVPVPAGSQVKAIRLDPVDRVAGARIHAITVVE